MHPSNKEGTGSQSFSPAPEHASVGGDVLEMAPDQSEQAASGAERALTPSGAPSTAVPTPQAMTIPLPASTPVVTPAVNGAVITQSSTLPADDGDLIEKEWVTKAKQIVERTRNDPYKQSEDLTLFKADYMRKRYGKTIKVSR